MRASAEGKSTQQPSGHALAGIIAAAAAGVLAVILLARPPKAIQKRRFGRSERGDDDSGGAASARPAAAAAVDALPSRVPVEELWPHARSEKRPDRRAARVSESALDFAGDFAERAPRAKLVKPKPKPHPRLVPKPLPPTSEKSTAAAVAVPEYDVVETAADGNCLFHCFVFALRPEFSTTVRALREEVAQSVGEDQFQMLKVIYDDAKREKDWDQLQDYSFMEGVDSLEALRQSIRTPRYWGDEMALTALEKFTKLTPVVITQKREGVFEVARRISEDVTKSATKLYMILFLHHAHYRLVKYRGRTKMRFGELPPQIREKIEARATVAPVPASRARVED